jgi:peptidoglycan/LPS O-acetylase OafA/YrhL
VTGTSSSYLDAPTLVILVGGLTVALVCLVSGLNGRPPGRVTVSLTWVLQVAVVGYAGIYLGRQLSGVSPVGPIWELWAYLVTIVLLPALAIIWAREERTRWSTFVLAVAAFTAAVMAARTAQIWAGVGMMTAGPAS